jgi:hypothetical protein
MVFVITADLGTPATTMQLSLARSGLDYAPQTAINRKLQD